jgi:hypothetical protein
MISRPVITDFHIKRALVKAQMCPPNSLEQYRSQSQALRLVEIKANEARFIQEGKEIESILETLGPRWNFRFWENNK